MGSDASNRASDPSTRRVLTDAARREQFAAEALPHVDGLYSAALGLTRDPTDAQDLVQETVVKAYRSFHQFEPGTNVRAWMYRILHTTWISLHRRDQRRPAETLQGEFDDYSLYDDLRSRGGDSVEAEVLDRLSATEVRDAMAALPETFRMAVFLADVEGFSYREIADIMDTPIGTVMSRLHRGRSALQKALAGYARSRGLIIDREEPRG